MQSPKAGFVIPAEEPPGGVLSHSSNDIDEGVSTNWHRKKGVWIPEAVVGRLVLMQIKPESHYRVFLLLVLRACRYGTPVAIIKPKEIATSIGCGPRTVYRALLALQRLGVMSRVGPGCYSLNSVIDER